MLAGDGSQVGEGSKSSHLVRQGAGDGVDLQVPESGQWATKPQT